MSLLLLDTTILIDAERGRIDLGDAIADDDDVAIAAVTLAELMAGVHVASDEHRRARRAYIDDVVEALPVRPYDAAAAVAHAELLAAVHREGRPRGAHDLLTAATARATGRTVVTADNLAFAALPGVAVYRHR